MRWNTSRGTITTYRPYPLLAHDLPQRGHGAHHVFDIFPLERGMPPMVYMRISIYDCANRRGVGERMGERELDIRMLV